MHVDMAPGAALRLGLNTPGSVALVEGDAGLVGLHACRPGRAWMELADGKEQADTDALVTRLLDHVIACMPGSGVAHTLREQRRR